MGLLDTIKGWFNIGGVKVEMPGFEPVVNCETFGASGRTKFGPTGQPDTASARGTIAGRSQDRAAGHGALMAASQARR